VNLPSYLGWFVRFVKGFLCEMVQRKIELVETPQALRRHFDEEGLPSYYRA
jgi:hypothetical protein